MAKEKEVAAFAVKSALKQKCADKEMQCAGDLAEAVDKHIDSLMEKAAERAAANGRKTIRPEDL